MTDNKLIAEFMGMIKNEHDNRTWSKPEDFLETQSGKFGQWEIPKYDKSWDWLMPVVEKIEGLGFKFTIHNDASIIERTHNRQFQQGQFISALEETKIKATYKACVEFLEWYNNQQSK